LEQLCALCKKPFSAQRSSAKYCSGSCRARWAQGERPTPDDETSSGGLSLGAVAAATSRELSDAERLDTALGQAALRLAERLDSGRETGAAAAAVTRELRATLADALKGATRVQSPVEAARDELARRRAARGA
jgi:hypothetical protein